MVTPQPRTASRLSWASAAAALDAGTRVAREPALRRRGVEALARAMLGDGGEHAYPMRCRSTIASESK